MTMEPTPGQPTLADLMAKYLRRQAAAQADGLASPDLGGEVEPFESAPVQPVDGRLAWEEALEVLTYYESRPAPGGLQAPPHWPQLVAAHESSAAVAFCAGNYPQLVRNFQPLWQSDTLGKLRPQGSRPVAAPALVDWAKQTAARNQFPQTLLALGTLRLARQFDAAGELLQAHQAKVPAEWKAGWANETAALAWHRGQAEEAFAQWQALPESVPVLFNRGMAALFLDRPAQARPWLSQAVAQLADSDAWHHLGRLYLALAEIRRG